MNMPDIKNEIINIESIDAWFDKSILFLNSIGIETRYEKLDEFCFLPGLSIRNGTIIIDMDALKYPGDILHEAGHVAVVTAAERKNLSTAGVEKREHRDAEEMMAIAWSYAACIHLDIDPKFALHDFGYGGGGSHYANCFNNKQYFGLPMLQWKGMTADEKNAVSMNVKPYPHMLKWTLD